MQTRRRTDGIAVYIKKLAWSDFASQIFDVEDSIEIDLWENLPINFDGTVTLDTSGDPLPSGLSIRDGRYLQGTVTAVTVAPLRFIASTLRFIATELGVSVTSGDFELTVEAPFDFIAITVDGQALLVGGHAVGDRVPDFIAITVDGQALLVGGHAVGYYTS